MNLIYVRPKLKLLIIKKIFNNIHKKINRGKIKQNNILKIVP